MSTPGRPPTAGSPDRLAHAREEIEQRDPLWPAQLTLLGAILLYLALPEKLTIGPTWVVPGMEGLALAGLALAVHRTDRGTWLVRRRLALALTGLVSAVNLLSLLLLVHFLVKGGKAGGHPLIAAGVVLWLTNVLLFGVWYWELDRGGPLARALKPQRTPDFLFPQMADERWAPEGWRPGFFDYLYVSLTNATAFSPTDTMPLTKSAKAVMAGQSLASLTTVVLVVARAVNILG